MTPRNLLIGIPFALMGAACGISDVESTGGDVSITIQQSLTGATTAAGTFTMTGALSDQGQTAEELTFGGPLTQSPVPLTFRQRLTGVNGTIVIKGSASLAFTSPTEATISGTWDVESATGAYAKGQGTLTGSANFGATPPFREYFVHGLTHAVEGGVLTGSGSESGCLAPSAPTAEAS